VTGASIAAGSVSDGGTGQVARTQPDDEDVFLPPDHDGEIPLVPEPDDENATPKGNKKIQDRVEPTIISPGQPNRPNRNRTVRTNPSPSEIERRPLVAPPQTQFAPSTPQVSDSEEGPTVDEIDALILKQLEQQALEPAVEGDPIDITPRNQRTNRQTGGSSGAGAGASSLK